MKQQHPETKGKNTPNPRARSCLVKQSPARHRDPSWRLRVLSLRYFFTEDSEDAFYEGYRGQPRAAPHHSGHGAEDTEPGAAPNPPSTEQIHQSCPHSHAHQPGQVFPSISSNHTSHSLTFPVWVFFFKLGRKREKKKKCAKNSIIFSWLQSRALKLKPKHIFFCRKLSFTNKELAKADL